MRFSFIYLSLAIILRLYTLSHWSNGLFLIFDIGALSRECQSTRMSDIKNGPLDQCGAEPLNSSFMEQQALKGIGA